MFSKQYALGKFPVWHGQCFVFILVFYALQTWVRLLLRSKTCQLPEWEFLYKAHCSTNSHQNDVMMRKWSGYYISGILNIFRFRSSMPSIVALPFTLWWTHGRWENNNYVQCFKISLIFVQDLVKLNDSFKDNRSRH